MQLKPISRESIPNALVRAKHYRLLNQPWQAESICRDILNVDPDHEQALIFLILSISNQLGSKKYSSNSEAKKLCTRIKDEYERNYYTGLVHERTGNAALKRSSPRVRYIAYEHYRRAMEYYEIADRMHPENIQDAVLRWNACLRAIQEFNLEAAPEEDGTPAFLDV